MLYNRHFVYLTQVQYIVWPLHSAAGTYADLSLYETLNSQN